LKDLGVLRGGTESIAQSQNSFGTVVGGSATAGGYGYHAFVWTPSGGMKHLNHLIPAGTNWTLFNATAINNSGQIVGSGMRSGDFTQHAFLLTPTHHANQ
jgi:probable HAF family extracellular repeat protein